MMRRTAAAVIGLMIPAAGASCQTDADPGFRPVGGSFFAVQVPDVERAAGWYGETLGLEVINEIDAEDGRYRIRVLARPGLSVELIQIRGATGAPSGSQHGLFKAGFHVDDLPAAYRWLSARQVDMDPSTFVDEALNARTFVFRDPFGNRLQVFQSCDPTCPSP